MTATFETVLLDLVDGIEDTGVEYALVGGVAVLAWGDPRTTRDIDVIARLDEADVDRVGDALEPRGFSLDRRGARKAILQGSHFTIFHEDAFYHVDMLAASEPSHEWTLEGRRRVELEGRACWLASPEDTVANKLVFGSEQDVHDAAGILARLQNEVDQDRLTKLCEELGVLDDLERLQGRVDEALD